MIHATEGQSLPLDPARIAALRENGSYFGEGQLQVLGELAAYVSAHHELPTSDKLATFAARPGTEVRRDLNSVTLEGLLWVFGVETEAAA